MITDGQRCKTIEFLLIMMQLTFAYISLFLSHCVCISCTGNVAFDVSSQQIRPAEYIHSHYRVAASTYLGIAQVTQRGSAAQLALRALKSACISISNVIRSDLGSQFTPHTCGAQRPKSVLLIMQLVSATKAKIKKKTEKITKNQKK